MRRFLFVYAVKYMQAVEAYCAWVEANTRTVRDRNWLLFGPIAVVAVAALLLPRWVGWLLIPAVGIPCFVFVFVLVQHLRGRD